MCARTVTRIIRSFTFAFRPVLLSRCLLVFASCGEDNEAASRDSAAKGQGTVDPKQAIPRSRSMEDYARNNPGMKVEGAGKAGSYPGAKK